MNSFWRFLRDKRNQQGGIAIGRDVTGSTIRAGTTTNSDCAPKPK